MTQATKSASTVLRSLATAAQLKPQAAPVQVPHNSLAVLRPVVGTARAVPVPPEENLLRMRDTALQMLEHAKKLFETGGVPFDENRRHSPAVGCHHTLVPVVQKTGYLDMYRCALQGLRIGYALEEIDGMTTIVGHRHNQDPKYPIPSENSHLGQHPVGIVSAGYHRIDLPAEAVPRTDRNIILKGFVSWTGKTSMEITVDAMQKDDETGEMKTIFVGKIVTVTVTPDYKAGPCVPLKLETEEDRLLYDMGEREKLGQDHRRKTDLTRTPPTAEEIAVLRSLQLSSIDPHTLRRAKAYIMPSSQVPMSSAYLQTTNICMHSEMNAYYKLFGGYQIRTAYEAAHQLADRFVSGKSLKFLCTTNGSFLRPVSVGAVYFRDAQVCYTDGKYIQIMVSSYAHDIQKDTVQIANRFNFTFEAENEVPTVVPETFDESIRFLHGRRELQYALNPITV